MSKIKKKPGSMLPTDDVTFSTGSNYGLDGFYHDMAYNEGVLDGARLPESKGISALPDGFVRATENGDDFPEGVLRDEDDNFDLGFLVKEAGDNVRLPNLDWLDLETAEEKQDPNRLPYDDGNSIPDLEEAWGARRRTDGLRILPNNTDLRVAQYNEEIEAEYETVVLSAQDKREFVGAAIRRSEAGGSIRDITADLKIALGDGSAKIIAALEDDHGLSGNVFIRASAYPGCHNRDWTKHVQQVAGGSRYILAASKCTDCVHNQNDNCVIFNKRIVRSIPWKSAFNHYAPPLEAAGIKFGSENPREMLKAAFLSGGFDQTTPTADTSFLIQPHPADQVSYEQAQENLSQVDGTREKIDGSQLQLAKKRERVAKMLDRWDREQLLSGEEVRRLKASVASPDVVLNTAVRLVTLSNIKKQSYEGSGRRTVEPVEVTRDEAWKSLKRFEHNAVHSQFQVDTISRRKLGAHLSDLLTKKLITKKEARTLSTLAAKRKPSEVVRLAFALIDQRDFAPVNQAKAAVRGYQGEGLGAVPANNLSQEQAWESVRSHESDNTKHEAAFALQERSVLCQKLGNLVKAQLLTKRESRKLFDLDQPAEATMKLASALVAKKQANVAQIPTTKGSENLYSGKVGDGAIPTYDKEISLDSAMEALKSASRDHWVSDREVRDVLKWAALQMNEGMAGEDFDQILRLRFSGPLLAKAANQLNELRADHEGLAGHLYVDTAIYASDSGTTGCEQGGTQHRANGIPFAIEMDRCRGCTFKNVEGFCQKYNKRLISEMPIDNHKEYQADMIRQANAQDHEVTASLFAGTGAEVIDQFGGLENTNVDGFEFFGSDVPSEGLEVLWGGSFVGVLTSGSNGSGE